MAHACIPGPVRDETRSGGLHFNDVLQHMSVDQLPFSGVGESGCMSSHTYIRATASDDDGDILDGHQSLRYGYDEYSYLRSSVDIPLA